MFLKNIFRFQELKQTKFLNVKNTNLFTGLVICFSLHLNCNLIQTELFLKGRKRPAKEYKINKINCKCHFCDKRTFEKCCRISIVCFTIYIKSKKHCVFRSNCKFSETNNYSKKFNHSIARLNVQNNLLKVKFEKKILFFSKITL